MSHIQPVGMKVCSVCLNSDILCSGCSQKLAAGTISETDVAVSRAITALNKTRNIAATFLTASETDDAIIIMADKKDTKLLIGGQGRNVKQLSSLLGKQIRIIERTDEKDVVENVLRTHVIGINSIFDRGKETRKIRIDTRLSRKIRHDYVNVLKKFCGKAYTLSFE